MAAKKKQQILVMKNGSEYVISGSAGKYYVCGKVKFRKNNPQIAGVKKQETEAE